MIEPVPINLVVEDDLSENMLRIILSKLSNHFAIGICFSHGGYGYIKQKIRGFNIAAKGTPFLVLSDLESNCPVNQINEWLPVPIHPNLIFRIAVKEVESWILADRNGFASFIHVSHTSIPENADEIDDPKEFWSNCKKVLVKT